MPWSRWLGLRGCRSPSAVASRTPPQPPILPHAADCFSHEIGRLVSVRLSQPYSSRRLHPAPRGILHATFPPFPCTDSAAGIHAVRHRPGMDPLPRPQRHRRKRDQHSGPVGGRRSPGRPSCPVSASGSPVVWGDRIFLLSADKKTAERYVLALDAKSGQEVWRRTYPSQVHRLDPQFPAATPAAPPPSMPRGSISSGPIGNSC